MNTKEVTRWAVIVVRAALGCYGIGGVVEMTRLAPSSWFSALFLALFAGMIVGLPFATATLLLLRRYEALISMLIGVGAVVTFFATASLLRRLGLDDALISLTPKTPLLSGVGLLIGIIVIALPFLAASRFIRLGHQALARYRQH